MINSGHAFNLTWNDCVATVIHHLINLFQPDFLINLSEPDLLLIELKKQIFLGMLWNLNLLVVTKIRFVKGSKMALLVLHSDMVFVKSFTPADFPKISCLPEKADISQHFRRTE